MRTILHGIAVTIDKVNRIGEESHEIEISVYGAGDLGDATVLCFRHWIEDLVFLIVASVLMVLPMRNPPRVKGN